MQQLALANEHFLDRREVALVEGEASGQRGRLKIRKFFLHGSNLRCSVSVAIKLALFHFRSPWRGRRDPLQCSCTVPEWS